MGKCLDTLDAQTREAVWLVAQEEQKHFVDKYPHLAPTTPLLETTLAGIAESIAKMVTERGGVEDLLRMAEDIRIRAGRNHAPQ